MNSYVKRLVTEDLGFGQQIEDTLKKLQLQKEQREAEDAEEPEILNQEDYEKYYEEVEKQKTADFLNESYKEDEMDIGEQIKEYKKQGQSTSVDAYDSSFDLG